jgi:hypothetical protein
MFEMKNFLVIGFLIFGTTSFASGQSGQQSETSFYGIGLGTQGRGAIYGGQRSGPIGFQVGVQNDITLNPFSVSNSFPAFDTLPYGRYRTTPTYGFDVIGYFGKSETQAYVSLGLYVRTTTFIGRSPSTDLLYDLGNTTDFIGAYGVGITQQMSFGSRFNFGYHTQLGWNLGLSFTRF